MQSTAELTQSFMCCLAYIQVRALWDGEGRDVLAMCRQNIEPLALKSHSLPTHLQKSEYFFKDTLHVRKEGHTVDRNMAMQKGFWGVEGWGEGGFPVPGKGRCSPGVHRDLPQGSTGIFLLIEEGVLHAVPTVRWEAAVIRLYQVHTHQWALAQS